MWNLIDGYALGSFIVSLVRSHISTIMNQLKPIPSRAQIVEFSLQKTSRGVVQVQKPMDRADYIPRSARSASPRKRQRFDPEVALGSEGPVEPSTIYLDYESTYTANVMFHCFIRVINKTERCLN